MNEFTHIMRIGTHAEADFFRKLPAAFDALMINANLLAGTPAASAAFISGLKKPYIIDPFTHAFPLPPRYLRSKQKSKTAATAPKRTFVELGRRYFPEVKDFVGIQSLQRDDVNANALAQHVMEYQAQWFNEIAATNPFLLENGVLTPLVRIGPYFTMKDSTEWLDTNIACLKAALQIDKSAASVIAVTLPLIREKGAEVVAAYRATGVKMAFLWIESFDEDAAAIEDLAAYCGFVSALAGAGIAPVNLFGGFFSCIAADHGLAGFVHGLVYGENKAFAPVVGGGQPPPRYYFKPLHIAQNVLESQSLLLEVDSDGYLANVCDCQICQRLVSDAPPAVAMTRFAEVNEQNKYLPTAYALCRFHFMLARRDEVLRFRRLSSGDKVRALQSNIDFLGTLGASDLGDHLKSWRSLITDESEAG